MAPGEFSGCPHSDLCEERFMTIARRIDDQEARVTRRFEEQESRWTLVWNAVNDMRVKLATMEGRLAGYLVAATLLGTTVAFIAAKVLKGF